MIEQWKLVSGFAYEVSSIGRVRRVGKKIPRRLIMDDDGYLVVALFRDGIRYDRKVHQLVCSAFNQPRPNRRAEVRHLDGVRRRNIPKNLTWGTTKQNADDRDQHGRTIKGESHRRARFSNITVQEIRRKYETAKAGAIAAGGTYVPRGFIVEMGAELGIDRVSLHRVLSGGSFDIS